MVSEDVLVFDNLSGKLLIVTHANPGEADAYIKAEARLDGLVKTLREKALPQPKAREPKQVDEAHFVSGFTQNGFENAVRRVKEYIVEGDVMQVVLSQRLSIPYSAAPLDLYRALRCLNPSPYMYNLNLGDFHIVGSSPEILVRLENGTVTVRPIAGTRKRGKTPEEDLALEKDLLADPKEIAEHLMLIDLGRNDAGRVAQTGTVKVTDRMIIERYSHVMHLVSNISCDLLSGSDAFDLLRATFPAGTLSGAPKIRAMEIIAELEHEPRGPYGGALGYISFTGNMDLAITIRTATLQNGTLTVRAGAGIVADSDPERERLETVSKAKAMQRALELVHGAVGS
jgi:anthranilate synthase component 1